VNTEIFERQTFVLQTDVSEEGRPIGKKFQQLACLGFNRYSELGDDQKYEQIICTTPEPRGWDDKKTKLLGLLPLTK
jgi:hypothetical protein